MSNVAVKYRLLMEVQAWFSIHSLNAPNCWELVRNSASPSHMRSSLEPRPVSLDYYDKQLFSSVAGIIEFYFLVGSSFFSFGSNAKGLSIILWTMTLTIKKNTNIIFTFWGFWSLKDRRSQFGYRKSWLLLYSSEIIEWESLKFHVEHKGLR